MTSDRLSSIIESCYGTFLRDFETIVNIDSSSDLIPGIDAVARFFRQRLEAIGFTLRVRCLGESGIPCLEGFNKSGDGRYDVMFLGHMDTVFPPGEVAKRPFSIQGNRAFGPGVCDMKGGLLVALHSLEALHAAGILDSLNICVAFNGDEETGSKASTPWIQGLAEASDRVFVFEPCRPDYRFVLRRKGGGWFNVLVQGVSAHAGADPHKGANAVVELAHQVVAITSLNDPGTGTTAQVTVINGGDKVNIIPAQASASVDVRIEQLSEKERVERFFRELPRKITVPGTVVTVEGGIERPPMEPDASTMALWELIRTTADTIGIQADYIATGGCSDGNYTSAAGASTIDGMGLVGANSHRPDEYVDLEAVVPMIRIVAGVCSAIADS